MKKREEKKKRRGEKKTRNEEGKKKKKKKGKEEKKKVRSVYLQDRTTLEDLEPRGNSFVSFLSDFKEL